MLENLIGFLVFAGLILTIIVGLSVFAWFMLKSDSQRALTIRHHPRDGSIMIYVSGDEVTPENSHEIVIDALRILEYPTDIRYEAQIKHRRLLKVALFRDPK